MTATQETDFSKFHDEQTGIIDPNLLTDFRFGNQRKSRNESEFKDLVSSVKSHKIIQPLTVWFNPENPEQLECIAGHGRRDAAIIAKLPSVPFIFRVVTDEQAFEMHLAENLEREDLSTVSLAKAIQHYLTRFKGDYEATASKLNITLRECKELVELNKCCDKVLNAIDNNSISPSHAIILAPFPHVTQEKNLNTIIAEGWTVKTLRERAGKAKLPLDKGIFDKAECENCEFNTNPQLGLWGSTDTKAQCAKPVCFQKKTTEHLEAQKSSLEEKYGRILLLSECDSNFQNEVTVENVGKTQFATCITCDNRISVLNDSWSKAGQVTQSQCTDKLCFTKCNAENKKAVLTENKKTISSSLSKSDKPQTPKKKAVSMGAVSPAIKTQYDLELRNSAKSYFKDDSNFTDSLLTASLVSQASFKIENSESTRFSDALVYCLKLDNEKRALIRKRATTYLLETTNTDCNQTTITSTLIKCLSTEGEKAEQHVIESWEPTDSNLKIYTIEVLEQLAKSAGVERALESKKKGDFAKLMKQSKSKIMKGIQGANVDWKNYAPRNFKESLKKGTK